MFKIVYFLCKCYERVSFVLYVCFDIIFLLWDISDRLVISWYAYLISCQEDVDDFLNWF